MKNRLLLAAGLLACITLIGCGKKEENTNLLVGMSYIEELSYQNALDTFEMGIEAQEDLELLYRGKGIAFMGLSDYENARDSFLLSIENAGSSVSDLEVDTNFYLAAAYYKLEQYEEAEKIYTAILNYKGKDKDACYLRGCTYLKMNDYEKCMEDFEKVFTMDPEDMDIIIDAFNELVAAGYESEGTSLLKTKMENNTSKLNSAQKGTLYFYLEDYDQARIYLEDAVNNGKNEMSLLLGRTYEKLGDMNYASVVYQKYLDSDNENAQVYNNLGICLMTQGKSQDALEAFQKGIDLGNSNVIQNLKFNEIVAYEKLSNFSEAKVLMEAYLQAYPDDAKALREYEFLKTR